MWEGLGVITYGRKLIGATDPQKSEPGTIRGDLAVVVGRYCFAKKRACYLVSYSLGSLYMQCNALSIILVITI